jgi:alginate O-acetyltransferase complex protein AlgI
MLFTSFGYFGFLLVVLALFYSVPHGRRKRLLLLASYLFYASWNWRFVPLLAGLTLVDYFAAIWVVRTQSSFRKLALFVSLVANLGVLGFFKYYNFGASIFATMLGLPQDRWHLAIILPLGISFHTFQSISYIVDVYRGQQAAVYNLEDYALFISFFPQLVAGPIVRAREFFQDLTKWQYPEREEIRRGMLLIVLGVAKKLALADNLASIADSYFKGPVGDGPWTGVLAFALQIYFDFSGYTDIAIGSALLLGFQFPVNFRRPYLASSITDFWRRWHISLSSWLRDYVYIPLGGNRRGRARTYRNLFVTMTLGGLWHGANWTFLAWGGYHGVLLAVERALGVGRTPEKAWSIVRFARCLLTCFLACIGWVFFRADSLRHAVQILSAMVQSPRLWIPVEPALMVLLTMTLVAALAEERANVLENLRFAPLWAIGTWGGVLLFVTELFATGKKIPFVYFQF